MTTIINKTSGIFMNFEQQTSSFDKFNNINKNWLKESPCLEVYLILFMRKQAYQKLLF